MQAGPPQHTAKTMKVLGVRIIQDSPFWDMHLIPRSNYGQFAMIWFAAGPNLPPFILALGALAFLFAMSDIMVEVWFICEHLYK